MTESTPHAALIRNREGQDQCYGYGSTLDDCRWNFRGQIAGAGPYAAAMLDRVRFVPLTDDAASEVAEMLAAPALGWNGTNR